MTEELIISEAESDVTQSVSDTEEQSASEIEEQTVNATEETRAEEAIRPSEDGEREVDELEALRAELRNLKELLAEKEAEKSRALEELEDFNRLFPEVSVKSIPEDVWKRVDGGLPLSAAYALYEKENARISGIARQANLRNAALSAGRAGEQTSREYFSPDEVRAMSQKEVHENYQKIRNSMKHW